MVEREGKFSTMAERAAGSYAVAVLEAVIQWRQQQSLCGTRYWEERGRYILDSWSRHCSQVCVSSWSRLDASLTNVAVGY